MPKFKVGDRIFSLPNNPYAWITGRTLLVTEVGEYYYGFLQFNPQSVPTIDKYFILDTETNRLLYG